MTCGFWEDQNYSFGPKTPQKKLYQVSLNDNKYYGAAQAGQLVNFLSSWTPPPDSLTPQHTVCCPHLKRKQIKTIIIKL